MIPFYSKRNQVYPCLYHGGAAVEKHFSAPADWRRERELYAALSGKLPVPAVLAEREGVIITRYEPYPTFLVLLERQEAEGFNEYPWRELARWLKKCHALSGMLPEDGNLRNFLWNSESGSVIGLDLESLRPMPLPECGAAVIAAVKTYDPEGTAVKRQAAAVLAECLDVPPQMILSAESVMRERRGKKKSRPMSGIILAGGQSSRMGTPKALLGLEGETLLQRQADKLRTLGIEDVMISGGFELPDVRSIADEYPQRGPLGGLHACLKAAKHERCLVLSVDAPLIPVNALAHLCRAHTEGVTVLRHEGGEEPLVAVYDSGLHNLVAPVIEFGGAPVRRLREMTAWNTFDYRGPLEFLQNCNTPEDFARMTAIAEEYRRKGLPL